MITVTVQKDFIFDDGSSTLYTFSANANTEEEALVSACQYASMVEYGLVAQKWQPKDMPFTREQLYQFIQPSQLDVLESMYPDTVAVAYQNAYAYIQSYVGNMFDVDAMLDNNDTSATALTLRLALVIQTVIFILAASPQYAETIEMHNRQLHTLLKGLKTGNRNFGKGGIVAEPDVRVDIVKLQKSGSRP